MNRTHAVLSAAAALTFAALAARSPAPATGPRSQVEQALVAPEPPAPAVPMSKATAVASTGHASGAGPLALSARLSSARVLAGRSTVWLEATVGAEAVATGRTERQPVNLALALDRSGSMAGTKLAQAKRAAEALIAALGPQDRLAIVAFGSDVTVMPSTRADADGREALQRFVGGIADSGGTNISAALVQARSELLRHREAYRVSRVILLSDGQPTEGQTGEGELKALVRAARAEDITTSAFGVGLDFNSGLMGALAYAGAGFYAFIEDAAQLATLFEKDLSTASSTVARRVEVWVKPRPGVTVADVPGHEGTRVGEAYRVGLYDLSGGQSAQLLARLELAGAPADGAVELAEVKLRYLDLESDRPQEEAFALSAQATLDPADVEAHADAQVVERAKKVDVARQLQQASAAYQRGDRGSALDIFGNIRRQFGMSADALAGESLDDAEKKLRSGGNDGARTAKDLTAKTMKSFGQNNTY